MVPGSVCILPITTAAGVLSLQTTNNMQPAAASAGGANNGISGAFADQINGLMGSASSSVRLGLLAVTATVGIILGKTILDVTGTNATAIGTAGTLTAAGIFTHAVGECFPMIPGHVTEYIEFEPQLTQDFFLGFVGSTSGTLVIFQVSSAGT